MSDRRSIGMGGIALVPAACCLALPVLASVGVALGFGVAAGGAALIRAAALVARGAMSKRTRRRLS